MTITIVVPIYNEAPFLRRCLDSIKNQTEKPDEVILIDDCSTDGSAEQAQLTAMANGWKFEQNIVRWGVSHSRNHGFDEATSDYVFFLDADDELTRDAVTIMKKYARGSNIVQFNHWRKYENAQGMRMKHREEHGILSVATMPGRPLAWFAVWNKIYRREWLVENGLRFNEALEWGEDELFNLEAIIENGCIRCETPALCIRHFDNKNSLNHTCRDKKHDNQLIAKIKTIKKRNPRLVGDIIADHKAKQEEME